MAISRVLVVSDTHVPTIAQRVPEKILAEALACDLIIHAGDIVSSRTLENLVSLRPVEAVRGNMDFPEVASKLPLSRVLRVGKWRVGITHGHEGRGVDTPDRALNMFPRGEVHCVVFGHSHVQLREEREGVLMFNPGSPVAGRGGLGNSYGILEISDTLDARIVRLERDRS